MEIFLLRHGETDWNKEGRLQGRMDVPMNENGRKQISSSAIVLARILSELEVIISSPLVRAYESAKIVAEQLSYEKDNIILEPMVLERSFGVGEGLIYTELTEKFPDGNYPESESVEALIERAGDAFKKIVTLYQDKKQILIVAHGAILYAMLTAITEGEIPYGGNMTKFDEGSIHRILFEDGIKEIARYSKEEDMLVEII